MCSLGCCRPWVNTETSRPCLEIKANPATVGWGLHQYLQQKQWGLTPLRAMSPSSSLVSSPLHSPYCWEHHLFSTHHFPWEGKHRMPSSSCCTLKAIPLLWKCKSSAEWVWQREGRLWLDPAKLSLRLQSGLLSELQQGTCSCRSVMQWSSGARS